MLQYNLTVSSVVKSLDLTDSRARILEECKLEHGFQLQSMIMNKRHQRKKYMQNLISHIYALHYQKQLGERLYRSPAYVASQGNPCQRRRADLASSVN